MPMSRRVFLALTVVLVLTGCSSADEPPSTAPVETVDGTSAATSTTEALDVPEELSVFPVKEVVVGDRVLALAIADDPGLRALGLMGVSDLGDLDGMLFFWRHDGDDMWMKDTIIPLDIVWFNEDGSFKDRASMVPCPRGEPCPTYAPGDGYDFRYAIEAEPGTLDWIDESTVISYTDD